MFATATFFTVTVVASLIYYKRIKEAQAEYDNSKDLVRSITVAFSQQLKKVARSIGTVEKGAAEAQFHASEALKESGEAVEAVKVTSDQLSELSGKMEETDKKIESLLEEMQSLARSRPVATVQPSVDAAIPLRQDAVLERLTPTELEVLMLIEEMGEASGPAIRESINKTREHTARLLKKLYEQGFIDRNTSGMPYRYNVRKEIKELIQERKERMRLAI